MTDESTSRAKEPAQGTVQLRNAAAELSAGVVLLALLCWYLWQSALLPEPYNPVDIGAGGFPMLLGVATLIAVVLFLARTILRLTSGAPEEPLEIGRPVAVLVTAALFVAIAALFDRVNGFLVIWAFTLLVHLAAGERRPVHLVGVPVATTAGIWVVFSLLLNVHFL